MVVIQGVVHTVGTTPAGGTANKYRVNGGIFFNGSGAAGAILEDEITLADVTTLNASTSKHGLAIKATAPASGVRNVVAIDNGETAYKNTALVDSTNPAALGTAAPGTSLIAARRDHVHPTTGLCRWRGDSAGDPSGVADGDLWRDTSDSNKLKIRMGGATATITTT
jgi:hypothetical protein